MRINSIANHYFTARKSTVPKKNHIENKAPQDVSCDVEKMLLMIKENPALFCSYAGNRVIVFDPDRGFLLTERPEETIEEIEEV